MRAGKCCERCGGQALPDLDGDYSCLNCGFVKYRLYELKDDDGTFRTPRDVRTNAQKPRSYKTNARQQKLGDKP